MRRFFIMSSIWQHSEYYLFGFLFLVVLILIITCTEVRPQVGTGVIPSGSL